MCAVLGTPLKDMKKLEEVRRRTSKMIKEARAGVPSKDRSKWTPLFWKCKGEKEMIKVFEILRWGDGWVEEINPAPNIP